MIPIWALKALPYVGAVILAGGVVWYIDHRGYERAEAEAVARENEQKLQDATFAILLRDQTRDQEQLMQDMVTQSDINISDRIGDLRTEKTTIVQPTIVKEIASDPRFVNPLTGITDGMRGALNTARGASARPCPAGSNAAACFTLSPTEPAE